MARDPAEEQPGSRAVGAVGVCLVFICVVASTNLDRELLILALPSVEKPFYLPPWLEVMGRLCGKDSNNRCCPLFRGRQEQGQTQALSDQLQQLSQQSRSVINEMDD